MKPTSSYSPEEVDADAVVKLHDRGQVWKMKLSQGRAGDWDCFSNTSTPPLVLAFTRSRDMIVQLLKQYKTWLLLFSQEMISYHSDCDAYSGSEGEDKHRRRLTRMEPKDLGVRACKALSVGRGWWSEDEPFIIKRVAEPFARLEEVEKLLFNVMSEMAEEP